MSCCFLFRCSITHKSHIEGILLCGFCVLRELRVGAEGVRSTERSEPRRGATALPLLPLEEGGSGRGCRHAQNFVVLLCHYFDGLVFCGKVGKCFFAGGIVRNGKTINYPILMRHFGFDTSRFFRCVVRLCASKTRSSETKIANPKQVCYYFPVPYSGRCYRTSLRNGKQLGR